MTWSPGRDRISDLLASGELESVAPDTESAVRLLTDSKRHLETARSAVGLGDLTGAYQLAYDALRKAAAALLAVQGLRATSRGGHIAIQDAVQAQFGGPGSPFRSFGRIRRSRNSYGYPDSDAAGPDHADVDDAVKVSQDALIAGRALSTPATSCAGHGPLRASQAVGSTHQRGPSSRATFIRRVPLGYLTAMSLTPIGRRAAEDRPLTSGNVVCPRAESNCRHPL